MEDKMAILYSNIRALADEYTMEITKLTNDKELLKEGNEDLKEEYQNCITIISALTTENKKLKEETKEIRKRFFNKVKKNVRLINQNEALIEENDKLNEMILKLEEEKRDWQKLMIIRI